jgi:hypothetical protein
LRTVSDSSRRARASINCSIAPQAQSGKRRFRADGGITKSATGSGPAPADECSAREPAFAGTCAPSF